MPFAFLFGLYVTIGVFSSPTGPFTFKKNRGAFSTIFLFMVDMEKSRVECEEFVAAEAEHQAFTDVVV